MIRPLVAGSTEPPTPLWSAVARLASPLVLVHRQYIGLFQRHTTPYIYFFDTDIQAGNLFLNFFIMVVNGQVLNGRC